MNQDFDDNSGAVVEDALPTSVIHTLGSGNDTTYIKKVYCQLHKRYFKTVGEYNKHVDQEHDTQDMVGSAYYIINDLYTCMFCLK